MRCPASFGGTIVIAGSSAVQMVETQLVKNRATCRMKSGFCTANGGSLGIVGSNTIVSRKTTCARNAVLCEHDLQCQSGVGGCVFANGGDITVANSILDANVVTGVGGGGAVALDGTARVSVMQTEIRRNNASQGGGFLAQGRSTFAIRLCSIDHNNGTVTAGAIAAYDEANLHIVDSSFVNNTALRVSGIFG